MKTHLFNENESFTQEGKDFADEIHEAISSIVDKYKDDYSLRDMELITIMTASSTVHDALMHELHLRNSKFVSSLKKD